MPKPELVCELVSPIKPLQAAAYGIQVLVSSVEPLADLKLLGPGLHVYEKGSIDSLANKLVEILALGTPSHCSKTLYPGLEEYLWSRNVQTLLNVLSEAPHNLKRSFPWSRSV